MKITSVHLGGVAIALLHSQLATAQTLPPQVVKGRLFMSVDMSHETSLPRLLSYHSSNPSFSWEASPPNPPTGEDAGAPPAGAHRSRPLALRPPQTPAVLELKRSWKPQVLSSKSWQIFKFHQLQGAIDEKPTLEGLPPASIPRDEGGPVRLVGRGDWSNFEIPLQYDRPEVVLLDRGPLFVEGDGSDSAPKTGQIFGTITSNILQPPFTYTLDLPPTPQGREYDVDNNGKRDRGLQIWTVNLANNPLRTPNEPYLSPVEQLTQLSVPISSLITAPPKGIENTPEPIRGTFLLYASEAGQGFPSGLGVDGKLFTPDDPIVTLPQGYTVATLKGDTITFDRSREAQIDLAERPEDAASDFSEKNYPQAFNALIDLLQARYAYTTLRGIDWEVWRNTYLPRVEAAERERDPAAYLAVLEEIAQATQDTHVRVFAPSILLSSIGQTPPSEAIAAKLRLCEIAGLGIEVVELADERVLVQFVTPNSPASQAGILPLAEIVEVNGIKIRDRITQERANSAQATPETRHLEGVNQALKFPPGERVTLRYRNPGEELKTTTLTAAILPETQFGKGTLLPRVWAISSPGNRTYGYLRWVSFLGSAEALADLHRAIADFNRRKLPGIVIDLRENGGGSAALLISLLSHFWSEENPLFLDRTFSQRRDPETGKAIAYSTFEVPANFPLYAPTPELYYGGEIVILTSENCVSACEFFTDWMQRYDRATAISLRATAGAGGYVTWVNMPEDATFSYTYTQELDRQGNPYIEGKGVSPNLRVPITEAFVRSRRSGGDPLLDAALNYLDTQLSQTGK